MRVELQSDILKTPRVLKIESLMDLSRSQQETFSYDIDIPEQFNIGLIVGPSGSGKTTVLNKLLEQYPQTDTKQDNNLALIDWLDCGTTEQRIELLNSVGLGSVPLWRRQKKHLSNGEQHRADLAQAIANNQTIIFDEYTSVIDRTQAKATSVSIAKTIKRYDKQIILASCHYDIIEWLQPDWIYEPHLNKLTKESRRRPEIKLDIYQTPIDNWKIFRNYHYLSAEHMRSAKSYLATWEEQPVAWVSFRHFPHPKVKDIIKVHRLVVRPEYQGLGIGLKLLTHLASQQTGKRVRITTTHPMLIKRLKEHEQWKLVGTGSSGKNSATVKTTSRNFLMKTFELQ